VVVISVLKKKVEKNLHSDVKLYKCCDRVRNDCWL